jgi:hypothetical protein
VRHLARALQLIGLIQVGFALALGLIEGDIAGELKLTAAGGALFFVGWWLQKWVERA